ncbi:Ketosteroid isomerase homolog [Frankia sp. AiPs1]|uniref:nuclear transport factor 2 family protein n=1 Tax=Frankia sp. AiPa1 TaxID=573492 RepID=UPI00202AC920|nr:nuclear transport factor 2 family protein [Frankia sp. AiPa1]MCL9762651.1 nuclear transport factor 2 family protein [Frankia sp. AiPa1]
MSDSVADELAIRKIVAQYCHLCDDGRLTELVELFTPDGVFTFGTEHRGSVAMAAFFDDTQGDPRKRGRHLTVNTDVDVDGDTARAVSDFLFMKVRESGPVITILGRYNDTLRRDGGRWQFARRDVEVAQRP